MNTVMGAFLWTAAIAWVQSLRIIDESDFARENCALDYRELFKESSELNCLFPRIDAGEVNMHELKQILRDGLSPAFDEDGEC